MPGPANGAMVSVIMPIYNAARYLDASVGSVLRQTMTQIEIILVDDGSTDDSLAIMKRYQAADQRVSVIQQPNAGAGVARNAGLKVAKGTYLSFLDADDIFEPDMLRAACDYAEGLDADICIFRAIDFSDKTGRLSINHNCHPSDIPGRQPFRFEDVAGNPFHIMGYAWDKLFRRDFVVAGGFQFQALPNANDALFTYSALLQAKRICFLNRQLVRRRLETGANISQDVDRAWQAEWRYESALKAYLEQSGLWARYRVDFLNAYAGHWVYRLSHLKTPQAASAMFDFTITDWLAQMPVLELGASQIQLQHTKAVATLRSIAEHSPGQYQQFLAAQPAPLKARAFALAVRCWRLAWSVRLWVADRIHPAKVRSTQ